MGHHSEYIAGLVTDPRDIAQGAVGVTGGIYFSLFVCIAIDHLAARLQLIECLLIGIIASLAMAHGDLQGPSLIAFSAKPDIFTDKLLISIPEQRAGQQMGFAQDLKSV